MGFKLPGKSIQSGTSGHRSALKMITEQRATSALKVVEPTEEEIKADEELEEMSDAEFQEIEELEKEREKIQKQKDKDNPPANINDDTDDKTKPKKKKDPNIGKKGLYKSDKSWKEGTAKAKSEGSDLNALVKKRKGLKKGSYEYNKVQNKINSALGNKTRYDEGPAAKSDAKPTKTEKVISKGEDKKTKIKTKAAKRTGEVTENVEKRVAGISKKEARKKYGRGSKEHLAAKQTHLKSKEADRQGTKGGRKQSIFRRASSKINKKRQEKNKAKIDALETSPVKHLGSASHPTGAIAAHEGHTSKKTKQLIMPDAKKAAKETIKKSIKETSEENTQRAIEEKK